MREVSLKEHKHNWEMREAVSVTSMDIYLLRWRLRWVREVSLKEYKHNWEMREAVSVTSMDIYLMR